MFSNEIRSSIQLSLEFLRENFDISNSVAFIIAFYDLKLCQISQRIIAGRVIGCMFCCHRTYQMSENIIQNFEIVRLWYELRIRRHELIVQFSL